VLAAAGPAEVDGTTTNLEGRVSTVVRKVTPPGTARDDWMLAAELSRLLGTDLGLESPTQILEEIAAVAPSHLGLTPAALHADGARDGVLVGAPADAPAAPTPPLLELEVPSVAEAPAVDAYSLRLVATRRLYDLGTDVQHSPGLAGLTTGTTLRLHPHDFDRLGVDSGAVVTVTSASGAATLPVVSDPDVGRGAAAVLLHQPGPQVGALIDATATVTEVRVVKA
jgi:predicted molibdopterin-dependent oxidoreductase YjgC